MRLFALYNILLTLYYYVHSFINFENFLFILNTLINTKIVLHCIPFYSFLLLYTIYQYPSKPMLMHKILINDFYFLHIHHVFFSPLHLFTITFFFQIKFSSVVSFNNINFLFKFRTAAFSSLHHPPIPKLLFFDFCSIIC